MTAAPAATAAQWTIDPVHSEIEFSVRHLMIANVKGRFADPTGTVSYDPEHPGSLELDVVIPVATVDTRNAQRDAHLKSADFFDAEQFPNLVFKGKRINGDVTGTFKLIGDLTIRDVTREVTLDVTAEGHGDDPWGNERLGFSGTGKIDRREFRMEWNQALETGGVAVGHEVKLILNVEVMRPKS